MPTHIAHICLCLLTHKPTQRQSQKSAIANALLIQNSQKQAAPFFGAACCLSIHLNKCYNWRKVYASKLPYHFHRLHT